jgi:serine phosphatase RsbU (regulator of sigma subunit)
VRNFVETVRREEERLKKELELAQTRQRASLKIQVPETQSTYRTVHREVL